MGVWKATRSSVLDPDRPTFISCDSCHRNEARIDERSGLFGPLRIDRNRQSSRSMVTHISALGMRISNYIEICLFILYGNTLPLDQMQGRVQLLHSVSMVLGSSSPHP